MRPIQLSEDPVLCKDEEDLRAKLTIYVRDQHLKGLRVSFRREGQFLHCVETGKCWQIRTI